MEEIIKLDINKVCTLAQSGDIDGLRKELSLLKVEEGKNELSFHSLINQFNKEGRAPLHIAATLGDLHTITLLLDNRANPNLLSERAKMSPLHLAVHSAESVDTIKKLIEKGADVNIRSGGFSTKKYTKLVKGQTPLHIACEIGDNLAANVLIEAGADIKATDEEGNTPDLSRI